mmetsp:Transcript_23838/g.73901  ORF Transcript_23838/g.73901 Transcript_23838/m.73901 type:complete len:120 (+) Transcript_23838:915-1274(+)
MYLNNCRLGLRGSLEVLSQRAVQALGAGWDRCTQHFQGQCNGACQWGEDLFVDRCLFEVLGVRREDAFGLLQDERCQPPADWRSCSDRSVVALHAFRTAVDYRHCVANSAPQAQIVFFK